MEESKLNSDKIWTIQKKGRLNCEMIWKIWKKSKLKCEKIGIKVRENEMFYNVMYQKKKLTDISNVVFQTLRLEKLREKSTGK